MNEQNITGVRVYILTVDSETIRCSRPKKKIRRPVVGLSWIQIFNWYRPNTQQLNNDSCRLRTVYRDFGWRAGFCDAAKLTRRRARRWTYVYHSRHQRFRGKCHLRQQRAAKLLPRRHKESSRR